MFILVSYSYDRYFYWFQLVSQKAVWSAFKAFLVILSLVLVIFHSLATFKSFFFCLLEHQKSEQITQHIRSQSRSHSTLHIKRKPPCILFCLVLLTCVEAPLIHINSRDIILEAQSNEEMKCYHGSCQLSTSHVHCHKIVLSMSCDYLRALFQSGMHERWAFCQ